MGFHSKAVDLSAYLDKATYDSDEDGKIALAQLVDAVCSETEADNKIDAYPPSMTDEWKKYIMVYGI